MHEELNAALFGRPLRLRDHACSEGPAEASAAPPHSLSDVHPPPREGYRLLRVELDAGVDLTSPSMTLQIGRALWRHLDPGGGTPADFEQRHLVRSDELVAVWSRRGVVIAPKRAGDDRAIALEAVFADICSLATDMRQLRAGRHGSQLPPRQAAARTDQLLQRLAQLQLQLAAPEHPLMRRFFQASHLQDMLGMLRDLNLAAVEQVRADKMRGIHEQQTQLLGKSEENVGELVTLQQNLEGVEVGIVFFYANELMHALPTPARRASQGMRPQFAYAPSLARRAGVLDGYSFPVSLP